MKLKRTRPNRRKRTNSATCCLLSATFHPACRRHISLKPLPLPLVQLPLCCWRNGASEANVSVSLKLGRAAGLHGNSCCCCWRWSSRPRAYEYHLAAITLEHMHCSCGLVCVHFSVSENPANGDLLKRPALTSPSVRLPARCASSLFCLIPFA